MAEHAATSRRVIDASQQSFELQIKIFIETVDEILPAHSDRMTDDVPHRYFETALDPPRLV